MPDSPRRTSEFGLQIKSVAPATGENAGSFKALVATYTIDSVGDVIVPGAFGKSLSRWEASGDPIPVIWEHDWSDPFSHIGAVKSARETADGLEVEAQLDIDDNPKAAQIHRLLRARRVKSFSFGYRVLDSAPGTIGGKSVTQLRELDLLECGPCLQGINSTTELLEVKAQPAPPRITPADLAALAGPIPTITPAALTAWITERSPR